MAAIITPDGSISVPDDTPDKIRQALKVAASCQFCRFLTDLERVNRGEFSIEASIGPARRSLFSSSYTWCRVRFLIPREFPCRAVETVPLAPPLKWNPHQNGDWPIDVDPHANIICPPRLGEIYTEELLLPYIRHAYKWVSDALNGRLTDPEQRYEFPHLVQRSDKHVRMYIEGGAMVFPWVRTAKYGRALLKRIKDSPVGDGLHRVESLRHPGTGDDPNSWQSDVREGAFGAEEMVGSAPWVFVGDPVVEAPHRPPITWSDFSDQIQKRIIAALRDVSSYVHRVPLLLVGFAVPKKWEGPLESIVWTAIDLQGFEANLFVVPNGFRPRSDARLWPQVRRFIAMNQELRWLRCTDVSREALTSRNKPMTNIDGLQIAILGVGAVGSILARALSKLGPGELLLIDKESLEPGNLVRHEALSFQVEKPKASAIATLLTSIHNKFIVRGVELDVIRNWEEVSKLLADCDLVIDATGDYGVHEILSGSSELVSTMVGWCYVKPGPDFGVLVLRRPESTLTLADAELCLKEAVDIELWEQFEGSDNQHGGIVWPEPGCYHPTFNAPYHRLRMMTDAFLTTILSWLEARCPADVVTLFGQSERDERFGIENRIEKQIRLE